MVANVGTTVAILGTGRMGGAMAATLRRNSFDVVVWNRDADKASAVATSIGARVATTAAAASAGAHVVLTSLADDAAVEAVYLDRDGVLDGVPAGATAIDTSTIDPTTTL